MSNCTDAVYYYEDVNVATNSNVFERYSIPAFRREFLSSAYYSEMWLVPIIITVGIFGNILSIIVWTSPKLRRENSSAIYLAALSTSDLMLLLLYIMHYLNTCWEYPVLNNYVICESFQAFFIFFQYYSVPLVFAFTVERWIAICYPFQRERLCTPRRACIVCAAIAVCVSIFGMIQGYIWTYKNGNCLIRETWNSPEGLAYLTAVEAIMSWVLPISTLLFNIAVLKELRRITRSAATQGPMMVTDNDGNLKPRSSCKERNRESSSFRSTTIMLLTVSFYLILCTLPAGTMYSIQNSFANVYECLSNDIIRKDRKWRIFFIFQTIKEFIDRFSITHFAFNFIIYLKTGKAFRSRALEVLGCGRCNPENEDYMAITMRTSGAAPDAVNRNGEHSRKKNNEYV